jgi:Mrr N-terminal domain
VRRLFHPQAMNPFDSIAALDAALSRTLRHVGTARSGRRHSTTHSGEIRGSKCYQATYEKFLLQVLATRFKGKGDKHEVTKAVLALMQSRGTLGAADLERVSTGETRAENTIAWGRNALKERGLISRTSPRGTWKLTPKGLKEGQDVKL